MLVKEIFKFVEEEFACEIENSFLYPSISKTYYELIRFKRGSSYIPVSICLSNENVVTINEYIGGITEIFKFVFDLNNPKSIDEMSEKAREIFPKHLHVR